MIVCCHNIFMFYFHCKHGRTILGWNGLEIKRVRIKKRNIPRFVTHGTLGVRMHLDKTSLWSVLYLDAR